MLSITKRVRGRVRPRDVSGLDDIHSKVFFCKVQMKPGMPKSYCVVRLITDSITDSQKSTNVYELKRSIKELWLYEWTIHDCFLIDDHTSNEIVIYVIQL